MKRTPWNVALPSRPTSRRPASLGQLRFNSTKPSLPKLTHIDDNGRPSMVDVSQKQPTSRMATATGRIYLPRVAYDLVTSSSTPSPTDANILPSLEKAKAKARAKGDVLTVAQLAGIMACKRTADLIPLCHPLPLSHVSVTLMPEEHAHEDAAPSAHGLRHSIICRATVSCDGRTGVEMEALTAVSVGLLTVWDMLKAVAGKEMLIGDVLVSHKAGGKSGDFIRHGCTGAGGEDV
ncbi:hypothetical protein EWM64_g1868 [Hericium alpestre]|uniref:cyclic pyranopterin monophosphate synthase n=1 Tax=Hericium alpestre TaxID=135208 RepID=A0A4Z0A520_9AGAM|nr:hypothetical protein EWM64_g1868 [Hericium alpestre]